MSDQWQPIETAPRDGTEFQAWVWDGKKNYGVNAHRYTRCAFDEHGIFCHWMNDGCEEEDWDDRLPFDWKPTHWQPIPETPK